MSKGFNLTAELNLRGPANLRKVVGDIRRELGTIDSKVTLRIDKGASKSVDVINQKLNQMNKALVAGLSNSNNLSNALRQLGAVANSIGSGTVKVSSGMGSVAAQSATAAKQIKIASTNMEEFGKQGFLAVKRFAAFSFSTGGVVALISAIRSGTKAFIDFDNQVIRLRQVTGQGALGIKALEDEITRLATTFGVSSEKLAEVSVTLAQAGLSADDTRIALEALAKTDLAPSFDDLTQTTEGAIAALRQFDLQAKDLEGALGSINAVAAAFAVEASDIIAAIQRTGGVFASASKGVSEGKDALNEFLAVFTSVRATTRESAETIATGLRTIFTRIQREDTVDALSRLGIQLRDNKGLFVGAFEAVRRLSQGLNQLDPRSEAFSAISEELGGFRQIGKVIPLIQQFATAQKALGVAQRGQSSLTDAQIIAQQSLANQLAKVREQFLALVRDIGKSGAFQSLFTIVTGLAKGLLGVASAFKPIIPILGLIATIKAGKALSEFGGGFFRAFSGKGSAKQTGSNIGGAISGSRERERAEVTQKASEYIKLNTDALNNLTRSIQSLDTTIRNRGSSSTLARGGRVLGFNRGGIVPGNGGGDTVPAFLEGGEVVINRKAAQKYGKTNLNKLNKGGPVAIEDFKEQSTIRSFYNRKIQPKDEVYGNITRSSMKFDDSGVYADFWNSVYNKTNENFNRLKKGKRGNRQYNSRLIEQAKSEAYEQVIAEFYETQTTSQSGLGSDYPVDIIGKIPKEVKFTKKQASDKDILSKLFRYKGITNQLGSLGFTGSHDVTDPKNKTRPVDIGDIVVEEVASGTKEAFNRYHGKRVQEEYQGTALAKAVDKKQALKRGGRTLSQKDFLNKYGSVTETDKVLADQELERRFGKTLGLTAAQLGDYVFGSPKKSGMVVGREFVPFKGKQNIFDLIKDDLVPNPNNPSEYGFFREKIDKFRSQRQKRAPKDRSMDARTARNMLGIFTDKVKGGSTGQFSKLLDLVKSERAPAGRAEFMRQQYEAQTGVTTNSYAEAIDNLRENKVLDPSLDELASGFDGHILSLEQQLSSVADEDDKKSIKTKLGKLVRAKAAYADVKSGKIDLASLKQNKISEIAYAFGQLSQKGGSTSIPENFELDFSRFMAGGKVTRKIGYIDYDVINNPANKSIVEAGMLEAGSGGVKEYSQYLRGLAVQARKDSSIDKLKAIYGVAGSGKTTLLKGSGSDQASLRDTERFPVLSPKDIQRANEIVIATSTVDDKKLDSFLQYADRVYTLSSTTRSEQKNVLAQRLGRDASGVGLEGRTPGATSGAELDTVLGEALLSDRIGDRSMVLGRSGSGRLRRKKNNELVETIKDRMAFTWGGFSPTTRGHESILDAATAAGIPPERFVALVGANEEATLDNFRTAIFDQDVRAVIAKAGFGARGANVVKSSFGSRSVPKAFDIGEKDGRRQVLLPAEGSIAFTSGKFDSQRQKYIDAGYESIDLPRTEGISATQVRELISKGDLEGLQGVLSPGVYDIISRNINPIRNRSEILPTLIQQSINARDQMLAGIQQQMKALGISRIDNKLYESDPEYKARADQLYALREQRDKVKNAAKYNPYSLLRDLEKVDPGKYAFDFARQSTAISSSTGPKLSDFGKIVTDSAGVVEPPPTPTIDTTKLGSTKIAEGPFNKNDSKEKRELWTETVRSILAAQGYGYDGKDVILPTPLIQKFNTFDKEGKPAGEVTRQLDGIPLGDAIATTKFPKHIAKIMPDVDSFKAKMAVARESLLAKYVELKTGKEAELTANEEQVSEAKTRGLYFAAAGMFGTEYRDKIVNIDGQTKAIVSGYKLKDPDLAKELDSDFSVGVKSIVNSAASKGLKAIGSSRSPTLVDDSTELASIQGSLFEQVLSSWGAPTANPDKKSIDFPNGLGPAVEFFEGLDPDVPTDAKRTLRGAANLRDNITNYLKSGLREEKLGEVAAFAKGGKVDFGSGNFDFPAAIRKKYFEERDKKIRGNEFTVNAGFDMFDSRGDVGTMEVDQQKVQDYANSNEFNLEEFKTTFGQKLNKKSLVKAMADFARFVGLPDEDLSRALPAYIGTNMRGGLFGVRGYFSQALKPEIFTADYSRDHAKDLAEQGFTEKDAQDLFGLEELIPKYDRKIKKLMKIGGVRYDDGSVANHPDLIPTIDEKSNLNQALYQLKDKKRKATDLATKKLMEEKGYKGGFIAINDKETPTLYHELTHQLLSKFSHAKQAYNTQVEKLFSGDNDDLTDAFDSIPGASYNSADVVYGKHYKLNALNNEIFNTKNMDQRSKFLSVVKEADPIKNAKLFKPVNPKVNQSLFDLGMNESKINMYEDMGKEEFLTTLVQTYPQLNEQLTNALRETLDIVFKDNSLSAFPEDFDTSTPRISRFAVGGSSDGILARVSNGEGFIHDKDIHKIGGYDVAKKMNRADKNGFMPSFSGGGISMFKGPGSGTSDSIETVLPKGFVFRAKAMKAMNFNKGGAVGVKRFASGGTVEADIIRRKEFIEQENAKKLRLEEQQKQATSQAEKDLLQKYINDSAKKIENATRDLESRISGASNSFERLDSVVSNATSNYSNSQKRVEEAYSGIVTEARKNIAGFKTMNMQDQAQAIEQYIADARSGVRSSTAVNEYDTKQQERDRAKAVLDRATNQRESLFGSSRNVRDVRSPLTRREIEQRRDSDAKFFEFKARASNTSVSGVKSEVAKELGRAAYNIEEQYAGRGMELSSQLAGRQNTLRALGDTIQRADPTSVQYQDALSRLAIEGEKLAAEIREINPTLEGVDEAAKEMAKALSEGDVAKAQEILAKTLGDVPDSATALKIAMTQGAQRLGFTIEQLEAEFGSGGASFREVSRQRFIGSREGQRFGNLASLAPDLIEGFSKTNLGKGLAGAADFTSGKGGRFSQLFGKVGIAGLGGGASLLANQAKNFLSFASNDAGLVNLFGGSTGIDAEGNQVITGKGQRLDQNVGLASALGALGGAGSGAAGGAILGGQIAGPIGALVAGVGGAIIGGITGYFNAKNTQILTNALDSLSKTSSNLDQSLKKLDKEVSNDTINAVRKDFGENLAGQTDVRSLALSKRDTLGAVKTAGASAATGALAGAAAGALIGSFIPILGTIAGGIIGAGVGALGAGVYGYSSSSGASEKVRGEALTSMISSASRNQEVASITAEASLGRMDVASLSKAFEAIKNGTSGVDVITKEYQLSMLEAAKQAGTLNDETRAKIMVDAEELSSIDAYTKARKESGATDKQIEKDLETNRSNAIVLGKRIKEDNSKLLVQQQLLAKSARELSNSFANLDDLFTRIGNRFTRFSEELAQIDTNIQQRINDRTGNASASKTDRTFQRVLSNVGAYSREEVEQAANFANNIMGNTPESQALAQIANTQRVFQNVLPKLLRESVNLSDQDGDTSDVKGRKQEERQRVSDSLRNILTQGATRGGTIPLSKGVKESINTVVAQAEKDTAAGKEVDLSKIDKFSAALENGTKTLVQGLTAYYDAIDKTIEYQNQYNSLIKKSQDVLRRTNTTRLSQNLDLRRTFDQRISLQDSNQAFNEEVLSLTGGFGVGGRGTTDSSQIQQGIEEKLRQKERLAAERKAVDQQIANQIALGGSTQELQAKQQALIAEEAKLAQQINNGSEALEKLATDGSRAANVLSKIQERREQSKAAVGLFDQLVSGGREGRRDFIMQQKARQRVQADPSLIGRNSIITEQALQGIKTWQGVVPPEIFNKVMSQFFQKMVENNGGSMDDKFFGTDMTLQEIFDNFTGKINKEDPLVKEYRRLINEQKAAGEAIAGGLKNAADQLDPSKINLGKSPAFESFINELKKVYPNIVRDAYAALRKDEADAEKDSKGGPKPPNSFRSGGAVKRSVGGSINSVDAMVSPGELYIEPPLAKSIGTATLDKLNHAEKTGATLDLHSMSGVTEFTGPGTPTSDNIRTKLPAEGYVIRAKANEAIKENSMVYAAGGGEIKTLEDAQNEQRELVAQRVAVEAVAAKRREVYNAQTTDEKGNVVLSPEKAADMAETERLKDEENELRNSPKADIPFSDEARRLEAVAQARAAKEAEIKYKETDGATQEERATIDSIKEKEAKQNEIVNARNQLNSGRDFFGNPLTKEERQQNEEALRRAGYSISEKQDKQIEYQRRLAEKQNTPLARARNERATAYQEAKKARQEAAGIKPKTKRTPEEQAALNEQRQRKIEAQNKQRAVRDTWDYYGDSARVEPAPPGLTYQDEKAREAKERAEQKEYAAFQAEEEKRYGKRKTPEQIRMEREEQYRIEDEERKARFEDIGKKARDRKEAEQAEELAKEQELERTRKEQAARQIESDRATRDAETRKYVEDRANARKQRDRALIDSNNQRKLETATQAEKNIKEQEQRTNDMTSRTGFSSDDLKYAFNEPKISIDNPNAKTNIPEIDSTAVAVKIDPVTNLPIDPALNPKRLKAKVQAELEKARGSRSKLDNNYTRGTAIELLQQEYNDAVARVERMKEEGKFGNTSGRGGVENAKRYQQELEAAKNSTRLGKYQKERQATLEKSNVGFLTPNAEDLAGDYYDTQGKENRASLDEEAKSYLKTQEKEAKEAAQKSLTQLSQIEQARAENETARLQRIAESNIPDEKTGKSRFETLKKLAEKGKLDSGQRFELASMAIDRGTSVRKDINLFGQDYNEAETSMRRAYFTEKEFKAVRKRERDEYIAEQNMGRDAITPGNVVRAYSDLVSGGGHSNFDWNAEPTSVGQGIIDIGAYAATEALSFVADDVFGAGAVFNMIPGAGGAGVATRKAKLSAMPKYYSDTYAQEVTGLSRRVSAGRRLGPFEEGIVRSNTTAGNVATVNSPRPANLVASEVVESARPANLVASDTVSAKPSRLGSTTISTDSLDQTLSLPGLFDPNISSMRSRGLKPILKNDSDAVKFLDRLNAEEVLAEATSATRQTTSATKEAAEATSMSTRTGTTKARPKSLDRSLTENVGITDDYFPRTITEGGEGEVPWNLILKTDGQKGSLLEQGIATASDYLNNNRVSRWINSFAGDRADNLFRRTIPSRELASNETLAAAKKAGEEAQARARVRAIKAEQDSVRSTSKFLDDVANKGAVRPATKTKPSVVAEGAVPAKSSSASLVEEAPMSSTATKVAEVKPQIQASAEEIREMGKMFREANRDTSLAARSSRYGPNTLAEQTFEDVDDLMYIMDRSFRNIDANDYFASRGMQRFGDPLPDAPKMTPDEVYAKYNLGPVNQQRQAAMGKAATDIKPTVSEGTITAQPNIDPNKWAYGYLYKAQERAARAAKDGNAHEWASYNGTYYIREDLEKIQSSPRWIAGYKTGGPVYASRGGHLVNFKPKGIDKIPAMLADGEYVVNPTATENNLDILHAMNGGYIKTQKLSRGEYVKPEMFSPAPINTAYSSAVKSAETGATPPPSGPDPSSYQLTIEDKAASTIESFTSSLTSFAKTFGDYVTRLESLTFKHSLEGEYNINVNFTGAAPLEALTDTLKQLATDLVMPEINKLKEQLKGQGMDIRTEGKPQGK